MNDYRATGIPEKTRMKAEFPIIRSEKSNSVIRWGRHTEGRYFYLNRYFFILIDVCWSEVPSKPVVL